MKSRERTALAAAVQKVFEALDWHGLGEIYFHERGEAELRTRHARLVQLGEALAQAVCARVPRGGASLWVGAGLAELPVLLAEAMLLQRTVVAANLRGRECELLDRALRAAGPLPGVAFVADDARQVAGSRTFDHLGCISVFTDPETWPLLSDVAYGRIAPVQLDVTRFVAERDEAQALARGLFARLGRPGWITTSGEEAPWFLEAAGAAGASYEADDLMVETAMVGDPVGFLRVT
ncbi:MAG: hypothetical protein U1E73_00265 [Planctomycetota bacterium]